MSENDPDKEECCKCEGTGFGEHECGEDACCFVTPRDNVCRNCDGDGYVYISDQRDTW